MLDWSSFLLRFSGSSSNLRCSCALEDVLNSLSEPCPFCWLLVSSCCSLLLSLVCAPASQACCQQVFKDLVWRLPVQTDPHRPWGILTPLGNIGALLRKIRADQSHLAKSLLSARTKPRNCVSLRTDEKVQSWGRPRLDISPRRGHKETTILSSITINAGLFANCEP